VPDGTGWSICDCGGSGGSPGSGGETGSGGSSGSGGSPGSGGSGTGGGPCPAFISDGVTTCTQDGLICPKPCGVEGKGTKNCGCISPYFVFDCGTAQFGGCQYAPGLDLSCYQLPVPVPACSGAQHNYACSGPPCQPCSGYLDQGGSPKTGYCVCAVNPAAGTGGAGGEGGGGMGGSQPPTIWKCASTAEWPPQQSQ
jgi:hypothetical protein